MKQKLMVLIAAAVLIAPMSNVFAARNRDCNLTSTCPTYTAGTVENFLINETMLNAYEAGDLTQGQKAVIISDAGASDKWVKTLSINMSLSKENEYYDESDTQYTNPMDALLVQARSEREKDSKNYYEYARTTNGVLDIDLPSVEDIEAIWGAKYDEITKKYTIDITRVPETLKTNLITEYTLQVEALKAKGEDTSVLKQGFYTSTYDKDEKYVWVVTWETENDTIKSMSIEKADISTSSYGILPVLWLDKTMDCDAESTTKYSCYTCSENEYSWLEEGKQASTCTLVPEIQEKSKCVKNAKTGVQDYIVEFAGVVGICAVALVIVKRKDLFRNI